jgi:hypothetical protein
VVALGGQAQGPAPTCTWNSPTIPRTLNRLFSFSCRAGPLCLGPRFRHVPQRLTPLSPRKQMLPRISYLLDGVEGPVLQSFRNRVQEEMLMIASTEIRKLMPLVPGTFSSLCENGSLFHGAGL